jgi:hypothetical protein
VRLCSAGLNQLGKLTLNEPSRRPSVASGTFLASKPREHSQDAHRHSRASCRPRGRPRTVEGIPAQAIQGPRSDRSRSRARRGESGFGRACPSPSPAILIEGDVVDVACLEGVGSLPRSAFDANCLAQLWRGHTTLLRDLNKEINAVQKTVRVVAAPLPLLRHGPCRR